MRGFVLAVAAIVVGLLVVVEGVAAPQASVADRLAAAQKAGQTTFLLVVDAQAKRVAELRASAQAAQRKAPGVVLLELDRGDRANAALVKRYGLISAKLPLVLVLAYNGAPAGGATPHEKAAERLLSLLPSPRKADTLLALFEGKAAFVVVARPKMPGRPAAVAAAREAIKVLKGKGAVIEVGLDDKFEQGFLDVLGADRKATDVVVHVYGLSGRKTDAFKGVPTPEALVGSARKKQQCCPSGKCG